MRKRQRTRRQQRDGLILHSPFSIIRHQRCRELHAEGQFTGDPQAAGHEKTSFTFSSIWTSTSSTSPGRTICLNLASLMRVMTGVLGAL